MLRQNSKGQADLVRLIRRFAERAGAEVALRLRLAIQGIRPSCCGEASIRCMPVHRTTVTTDADDLAVLQAEARRRGVPLSQVLREAVARQAEALRADHRPRFGVGRGDPDLSMTSVQDEASPGRGESRD